MDTVKSTLETATAKVTGMIYNKKAVHFGGGNIGRGFVAEFLHKSGYEVVFVDVVDALVDQIKATPSYTVTEIGAEGETTFIIDNYRAINSKHDEAAAVHEIATADVTTCAVGPNILKFIAPVIAKAIEARDASKEPLAVIACENMIGGTDALKEHILSKASSPEPINTKARFANSAIDRIVPGQDPNAGLNVKIEKFYEWCVDKTPFADTKSGHPQIAGVHFVEDLVPFIERKLYTVNTSHATAAYYGHNRGKRTIHEAMEDPEIKKIVREAITETAHLIVNKHGITKQDQDDYVDKIITRISNPHLEDVVERVGRAPLRKIGRKERFIGPAAELAERGDKIDALLGGLEMALRFQDVEGDEESFELTKKLKELSAAEATTQLCGLERGHAIFSQVEAVIKKVQG